ncbi:ArsR/SmtB family transcription factor [Pseudonocardia acidicola]|uniref:ArsR/SmtB family transcription factor n=1 Tax=Pseudonocardia acidicola TaxID=2724939 RepID=UPI001EF0CF5C|nr:metalloregulator ArsR/SmtB family transcription factor [Pseudonocardia acidicola]
MAAAARLAGLLAAPLRLHLLWLLGQRDHDVGDLAHRVGATVPAVSHHLAKLRLAGLVTARRHGRSQIYRAADPAVITLVEHLVDHATPTTSPHTAGHRSMRAAR